MKGTIIGTDFLEKNDSVKILEINTNTTIDNEGANLLDYEPLFTLLVENNITELHFIYTIGSSFMPTNTDVFRFEEILKEKCLLNNIQYFQYTVPEHSVTVPFIEDSPNKFILRQSFDTTALVDEVYCANKFGFIDLMKETDLIPNSYFIDNGEVLDMLTSLPLNGDNIPNLIIKDKAPGYDLNVYPEIYKLDNQSDLNDLKTNLLAGKLIQEFVYDEANILGNRWSIIRGIDILFGPNLDVINLGGYYQTTMIDVDYYPNEFETGTNKYDQKTRYKYINKLANFYDVTYHVDADSDIIMFDGSIKRIDQLVLADQVKSLDFTDLNGTSASANDDSFESWDSTFEKTVETLTGVTTNVNNKQSKDIKTLFIRITLENGLTWVDSPQSTFYFEEVNSTETRWDSANKMVVGDKLILTNDQNVLVKFAVTSLTIEYFEQTVYELDVEPYDVFLSDLGEGYYGIMHNQCDCCSWSYCGNWCCYNYCGACGGGFEKGIT
jgi:hypothetical protein